MEKQAHSLVLFGLTLCSGTWDEAASCLKPLTEAEGEPVRNSYCVVISFKSKEEELLYAGAQQAAGVPALEAKPLPYNCPVLMSNKKLQNTSCHLSRRSLAALLSPLFHVPLRVAGDGSGIFLLCDSELHDVYM